MTDKKELNKEYLDKVCGGNDLIEGMHYVSCSAWNRLEDGREHSTGERLGPFDCFEKAYNAGLLWATIHHLEGYYEISYTTITGGVKTNYIGRTYYYPAE